MKHAIIKKGLILLLPVCLAACTKNFDELNRDPTRPTEATPETLITGAERSASDIIYNNFVNGRVGMLYAQYWSQSQNESHSQYMLEESSNNLLWNLYSTALTNLDEIIKMHNQDPEAVPANEAAIANILSVWIFQVLADVYGNIPYSNALKGLENFTASYDDAAAIYDSLVNRINTQLTRFDESGGNFRSGEKIFNGDIAKWRKLANSLKLRIGIRMADVAPDKARPIIEAAIQDGVMTANTDNALFPYLSAVPDQFPFNQESGTGIPNDYLVSKTLVDYMQSIQDPRLPLYARPATSDSVIRGKVYGLGAFGNDYTFYSYPGVRPYSPTFPGIIMLKAEVDFALAEAAARGFTTGSTAQEHYNAGIRSSMAFWQVTDTAAINAYIARVPYLQSDWRNRIGSQKWLALYMQGLQAWFERTRLEFRKPGGESLFVTPGTILDQSVTAGVPYRLTYPITEGNINSENYNAAGAAIGGNTKGTKLWWNK
ncbi:SusD/RagB family nutrient-binding outer membrane lipoprotein [Filimonas effusa]|uniref:SusD/RagB family nutrient-binding outer membrane lipoprotein n=1 Tax=Filimonas effusa TaxID=2508721 RepID=A0A4Q1DBG4_9BACT|nr:SusD/RagB family nutrient-binding outer membrane lipoprotein [Filimonas effusa]RXK85923.1 SusD/RagB family nutrient-binding outer membrane lipoprotein [Filimonas effusa]